MTDDPVLSTPGDVAKYLRSLAGSLYPETVEPVWAYTVSRIEAAAHDIEMRVISDAANKKAGR